MATKITRNGVSSDDLKDAIVSYRAAPDEGKKSAILSMFEKMANYQSGCTRCDDARKEFLDGLESMASGDTGGLPKMKLALQRGGGIVLGKLFS